MGNCCNSTTREQLEGVNDLTDIDISKIKDPFTKFLK
jgi:hypothetical protein